MDAVQLDFILSSRAPRRGGIVLLVAGAMAIFFVAYWRVELQGETQALESRIVRLERQAAGPRADNVRVDESTRQEIQRVNDVINQLALPWDRLFHAVEAVAVGPVTLLGIAPDAKSGMVQISAETTEAEAMFAYVKRLEQQSELTNVYLLEHSRDKRGGNVLRFVVTASWLAPQTPR